MRSQKVTQRVSKVGTKHRVEHCASAWATTAGCGGPAWLGLGPRLCSFLVALVAKRPGACFCCFFGLPMGGQPQIKVGGGGADPLGGW